MVVQENGGLEVAHTQKQLEDLSVGGQIVPVGEASTVLPTPDLSNIKAVDSQTKAVGIIYPPPDIRAIVDKTADFVGRNGMTLPAAQMSLVHTNTGCAYTSLKQKCIDEQMHAAMILLELFTWRSSPGQSLVPLLHYLQCLKQVWRSRKRFSQMKPTM
jgi:hypothetical protein